MSLINTTVETQIRTWFYMLYMTAGLKFDQSTTKEKKRKHWEYGRARVADACNDMVVEYVSSIISVCLIYSFSASQGPILVGGQTGDVHSTNTLLFILATQLVPELAVDFFCTMLEIKGGLMSQHQDYWSNFVTTDGLVKSFAKVMWSPCIVGWVLLMAGNL
ncbi:hypothetical protein TrVE_jg6765 [Triparma verrucosa]|uniref:Uncharacterized protein n=1 Tax=Triparma verrucosa TaxID=1606542 RepID=A0A9W7KVQ9_9STRA|nr:hypothetical protein TrVE_jg6765 [Triparma verrucosa]